MIEFTQYLRPNGQKRMVKIERGADIEQKASELLERGFYFEIEELNTGMVSITAMKKGFEGTVSIRLCPNGPEVPANVDELIASAYLRREEEFENEEEFGC